MDFSFQSSLLDQRKCEWENLRECGSESTLSDIIFPFFGIFLKSCLCFLNRGCFLIDLKFRTMVLQHKNNNNNFFINKA